jgi:hypothetical protein
VNELLRALFDVPVVDVPVRWPDPPDVDAELVAAVLTSSPEAGQRIRVAVETLLESAGGLGEFVAALDAVAIRFGQAGDGETCAALLDLSTVIREWGERA